MPAQHTTPPGQGCSAEHAVWRVVVVVGGGGVMVEDVVVGGGVSSSAGTQSSSTAFATSTAGPKSVLFTDTACAVNFVFAGSFAR